jgi:hypothetical protein
MGRPGAPEIVEALLIACGRDLQIASREQWGLAGTPSSLATPFESPNCHSTPGIAPDTGINVKNLHVKPEGFIHWHPNVSGCH